MTIGLTKEARAAAVASIERYHEEAFSERLGNMAAGALLEFFLKEIAPFVYNQAVADVQERLQARIAELDIDCHEEELSYWRGKRPR